MRDRRRRLVYRAMTFKSWRKRMTMRSLALLALSVVLAGCGAGPPPPVYSDAFKGIYNQSATSVPADVSVKVQPPVGVILSDNVEAYFAFIQKSNEYWGTIIPASLTNTVAMSDSDPRYISQHVLDMLKRHYLTATLVHDFKEAVGTGKKAVFLVDIKAVIGQGSFKTTTVDISVYAFDAKMNPVSVVSGHGEGVIPYPATEMRVQSSTDTAIQQLDGKITALIH
jgi:hypothetical protein